MKKHVLPLLLVISISAGAANKASRGKRKPQGPQCLEDVIASSRTEIVDLIPELRVKLKNLERTLKQYKKTPPVKRTTLETLRRKIAHLEITVRKAKWSPDGIQERYLEETHLAIQEAAHDLKNAMQFLLFAANELKILSGNDFEHSIEGMLNTCGLASNLFDFIEDPTRPSPARAVTLGPLFSYLRESFSGLPDKYKITVQKVHHHTAAYASRTDLTRMVQNLVRNAVDAMPNGGTIDVGVEVLTDSLKVPLNLTHDKPYLRITVSDNGPGYDPAFHPQPKPADENDEENVNPRGIGLRSVETLVERNGGIIGFDPVKPTGTCFSLYLPAIPRKMDARLEGEINREVAKGSVLVVDDDRSVHHMLGVYTKKAMVPMASSTHSLSMAGILENHRRNIIAVVLDAYLGDGPDLSGNIATIRDLAPEIPIIVSSAEAAKDLDLSLGVEFMPKPVGYDALVRALRNVEAIPAEE